MVKKREKCDEHPRFFLELGKLYDSCRKKGSVWVWMRRHYRSTFGTKRGTLPRNEDEQPVTFVRATNGKKKISTIVDKESMTSFSSQLTHVMRVNVDGLKKTQKQKGLKAKKAPPSAEASQTQKKA
uniref:Signal recognition particle 14 kDa protein n=1 Tax=Chromera velia CCMP2878 TaxID=1169474 RepID=A0A0G4HYS0_9ALVE|mmetsp:Transcript_32786/g.64956  ORF Transcript_32786/g.64956 Transcript_32786/m.64956 type:complete len:126 (+) Transcript_32786:216-593(+)|eukprot:Cvel_9557.t1-p1 / transcript=Cvel_9557.t1 / gene=Cvel_9557 / organism=Chromera_velia_CCMP2878 / gene_product=Signal recognition particle 14 kDa protein, putative / transcript_product=Signal recognition particle 14 kDa protein, putative / location=Cvel_scaffold553:65925-67691(+) / protein_length=125 / sequence_SO=supercontig / SO=protein_coding / is_pseudo=false